MTAPTYNFAYLDEQTKRMIRRALLKASLFSFVFLDSMGLGLGVFRSSCALATLYAVLTEKLVPSRPWDVAALAAAGTDCCSKTCSAKDSCCEALKSFLRPERALSSTVPCCL